MAKNPAGGGKGATKNDDRIRTVEAQNSIRRSTKARRKHAAASGTQRPTTHLFAEIASERRGRFMENKERQSLMRAQHQENIRLQSELALVLIAQWTTMSAGERLIAQAVAKAFVDSVKTDKMSRTAVAKEKVRMVWESNANLQQRVTKKELEKGFRIGGAALTQAGDDVFGRANSKTTEPTNDTAATP